MGNECLSPIEITTPMLCGSHGKQVWKRIGKCVEVLDTQSYPTVCDPMNCSSPGSSGMEFSRREYWSGLPFPSPGDLHDWDWTQVSHVAGGFFTTWAIWEVYSKMAFLLRSPWNHFDTAAAAAESLQSCPTLCNPRDSSPPGSPVPWVSISFSNAWKEKWKWSHSVVSDS